MITTVTLNPAIDKIDEIRKIKLGQVNKIYNQEKYFGGKGINVTRILDGLGIKCTAICFLGKNNLEEIVSLMEKEHISIDYTLVEGNTRTNT